MPDDVTGGELDKSVKAELSALRPDTAKDVARHLVMAGRLLDEDPEAAWQHAVAARSRAARLASVREAVGLAAYATGRYAEALGELRTVRRLTGSNVHLPVMADCERGMGRPERALELTVSDEARRLDFDGQVEMLIVAAGARTDLGQLDAAVVTLQVPELKSKTKATWLARLRSAYADALSAVGRTDEAQEWLLRALEADVDGEAGIADRLAEDEGLVFEDLGEDFEDDDAAVDEGGDLLPESVQAVEPTAAAPVPDADLAEDFDDVDVDVDVVDDEPAPAPVAAPPAPATTGLFQEPPVLSTSDDDADDDDPDDEPTGEEAKA
ncbi:hypothetical protein [Kineosporia sp. R_H_3]|uniref:hypothetical protein n=1 Tax=Kineosporia sp. R_H_3 TaxID=1961848 RepID=UPI000B4C12F0|nr:hypothetical protein [Kineosporia sp. R_H_3]